MNNPIDASIPVLTEIIYPANAAGAEDETAATPASPLPPSPMPDAVTVSAATDPMNGSATNPAPSEEQWQTLEQSLKEIVLKNVLARVDFVLEHRVRDNLADVLQTAVEGLANEIRAGLKNSLEELVTRAVTQEITKVKNSK